MKNTTITRTQSLVDKFDAIVNEKEIQAFDSCLCDDINGGFPTIRIGRLYIMCRFNELINSRTEE